MSKYIVFRPLVSKYQGSSFRQREISLLKKLHIEYAKSLEEVKDALALNNEYKVILITTTNCERDFLTDILKIIQPILWIHPNSGYDNITTQHLKKTESAVITGNEIRAKAVCLYIIQCLTKALGDIPFVKKWDPDREFPRELSKKILVYGYGHIGSLVANFLRNLDLQHKVVDPYSNEVDKSIRDDELREYDIIVLACSFNKSNKNFVNREFLSKCKKDVSLINPARGELVVFNDLLEFLNKHPQAKAFLDVYEVEPLNFEDYQLDNLYTSSHVAGVYKEIDDSIIDFEFNTISDFIELDPEKFENKYYKANLKNKSTNDFVD